MLLLFEEGLSSVKSQIEEMNEQGVVYINSELIPIKTRAQVVHLGLKQSGELSAKKENWAIMALARLLKETDIFPLDAFKEAVSARPEFAEANLQAIENAEKL
jgi:hypothetical protein